MDNVKNGSYKIVRPFNIVTKDKLNKQAQDLKTIMVRLMDRNHSG